MEPESKTEPKSKMEPKIYVLRTTANREDQVLDFVASNAKKKKLEVYSVIRPHGMRGYVFVEAGTRTDAEQAAFNVPYARGILPKEVAYEEIEHMLEQVKVEMNIQKNDICEIISGPFKREQAKVTRIDRTKEEIVVELLQAAVPIPITVKMDAVKVIRRETEDEDETEEEVPLMPQQQERKAFVMPGQEAKEKEPEAEEKEEVAEEKKEEKTKEKKEKEATESKKDSELSTELKETDDDEEATEEEEKELTEEEKKIKEAEEFVEDEDDNAELDLKENKE